MIRDSIHTLKLPMFLNEKIVHCSQQIIALVNNDEYYKISVNWKKDTLNNIFGTTIYSILWKTLRLKYLKVTIY